jgi:hypothetical protein
MYIIYKKQLKLLKMSVKSIMFEIDGLIKNAVRSCASIYGFSVEEALAKIDSNGNLIKAVKTPLEKKVLVEQKKVEKEEKQRSIEAEKAERLRLKEEKEAEKEALAKQKEALAEQKKAEKLRVKEAEKAERSSMKEEENLSKAAEKLALKASLKQQKEASVKQKKTSKKAEKKIVVIDETCDIVPTVPQSEDDDCFILFQNVPLMNEINSIRDVKKFKNHKKLSAGVKLARQFLDI